MMSSALCWMVLLLLPCLTLANVGLPVFSFRHENVEVSTPVLKAGHTLKVQDFTDYLSTIKNSDLMVTFLQDELSGEDFLRPDEKMRYGNLLKNVKMLAKKPTSTYFSSVKSPFHSLSAVMSKYNELIEVKDGAEAMTYLSKANLQKGMAILVHLPPTNVDESSKALKRNDVVMGEVMHLLQQSGLTYTAFYTGKHFRRMHEEVVVQGSGRHLLAAAVEADNSTQIFHNGSDCIIYVDKLVANNITLKRSLNPSVSCDASGNKTTITISAKEGFPDVEMTFTSFDDGKMWNLSSTAVGGMEVFVGTDLGTPNKFSYHCSVTTNFYDHSGKNNKTLIMSIKTIQVQVLEFEEVGKFGLAYDCVGFFTIPLWTGLLTALFLVAVTAYGLMMLSSVQTFDQYDDPKNKPLVVNISE